MDNGNYVVSSLKDKSLYFFKIDKNNSITDLNRVEVFERIRDIRYKENKLYMFLEDRCFSRCLNYNKKYTLNEKLFF